jgi:thiol-disulfide isomerase/thioredoxin
VTVLFLMCMAFAADGDLERERGRMDLVSGQVIEARGHVLNALRDAPEAHATQQLYLDIMLAGGQGPRALAELAGAETPAARSNESVAQVRAAVGGGDAKGAIRGIRALQRAWPDHPDLLLVLWEAPPMNARVAREQVRLIDVVRQRLGQEPDVLLAYRAHRFLTSVGADPSLAEAVLASVGEVVSTAPVILTRLDRSELARTLAKEAQPEVPAGSRRDRTDIAERLSQILVVDGRAEVAVAMWERFREGEDSCAAALGHAGALLEVKDFDPARRVADEALALAVAPTDTDIAVIDDDALRQRLALAWAARARALEGLELPSSALVSLITAHLIGGEVLDAALEERLRDRTAFDVERLGETYGSRPGDRAWAEAQRRAAEGPEAAFAPLQDAMFSWSRGVQSTTTELVRGYALQASLYRALEVPHSGTPSTWVAQAQVAATVAVLLGGGTAEWATRAALYEESGHPEAAFVSWASARAFLAPGSGLELGEALQRTHDGPGGWSDAAKAAAKTPPVDEDDDRTRVYPEGLFTPLMPVQATSGSQQRASPAVGESMPPWRVLTQTGGVIDSTSMQGRAIVLTFWASYCERCLQMMPEISDVVRGLRSEGYDVALVAISVDTDEENFSDVLRYGDRWGALVRAPDLAVSLGVSTLPSIWVVDGRGDVRYVEDSWASARIFGRQLRRILVE